MKKQIVFIESSPVDMTAKMAYTLRKKGYETVLVTLTGETEKPLLKKAYDKRYTFDFKFFKINLKNLFPIMFFTVKKIRTLFTILFRMIALEPYVVIARANPSWLCSFAIKFFRRYPIIYFPYDIRSFCYLTREEANREGVQNFELNAERYCYEHADGIIHKGSDDELSFLDNSVLDRKPSIKSPVIHFLPYCQEEQFANIPSKKLSSKDKEMHFVHPGSIDKSERWLKPVIEITNQKIHVHLYIKTANLTKEETLREVSEGNKLFEEISKSKYFHLHEPVEQDMLAKEIIDRTVTGW